MRRVLAISVTRIGDTLLTTPALRALGQQPGVQLDVLAHPKRMEVLEHLPFIHHLGAITPKRARWCGWISANLSAKPYDTAVVWGQDGPLVRYALRVARQVVAFRQTDPSLNDRLLSAVALPPRGEHAVRERLRLLPPLGVAEAGQGLSYVVTPEESAWAAALLQREQPGARLRVGLQLKSFHTKSHRDWPLGHFEAFVERLLARYPDAGVVVLGGPESRAEAAALAARFPGKVLPLSGRLSLRQAGAVMSHLGLYLGVDTGPTHLAGAVGIPMVALYHCAYPSSVYGPLERRQCVLIDHPALARGECGIDVSMAEISVDQVWDAATSLLEGQ